MQGDDALIAKGLEPGDTVVIEGQNQLRPGSKVALRTKAGDSAPPGGEGGKPGGEGAKPSGEGGKPSGADHHAGRKDTGRPQNADNSVAQGTR